MRLLPSAPVPATWALALPVLLGQVLPARPLAAQHLVPDSLIMRPAPGRPVIRLWEAGVVVGLTAGALAIDQSVRNDVQDDRTPFRNHLSDAGNALGNGVYVYPALIAGTLGGKALKSKTLERVSWQGRRAGVRGRAGAGAGGRGGEGGNAGAPPAPPNPPPPPPSPPPPPPPPGAPA